MADSVQMTVNFKLAFIEHFCLLYTKSKVIIEFIILIEIIMSAASHI